MGYELDVREAPITGRLDGPERATAAGYYGEIFTLKLEILKYIYLYLYFRECVSKYGF